MSRIRLRAPAGAFLHRAFLRAALAAALACVVPAYSAVPAAPQWAVDWNADVVAAQTAFEKAIGAPLRPGFRVEPTLFPHYYALRNASGQSAYFRDDLRWTANVRSAGWSIDEGRRPSAAEFAQWQRSLAGSIPTGLAIPVRRQTRFLAIVWSAPDCPFCRRLEQFLDDEGISVYVVPVGLSEQGFARAARAWCSEDPVAAWRAAFAVDAARPSTAARERSGCSYPRGAFVDVGFFLGRGRPATPIIVFADGSSISGWDGERGAARMREMLGRGVFFASP